MRRRTAWSLLAVFGSVGSIAWRAGEPDVQAERAPSRGRSNAQATRPDRRRLQTAMELAMGAPPSAATRCPLDVRLLETRDLGGIVARRISYASAPGERVPAWLLVPKGVSRPRRGALCLHQTTSIGKDEPAGFGGLANLRYARELAERGWVCLAPDYPTLGEHQIDAYARGWASVSRKAIWDNQRAVDLLVSLPEVDPGRLAVIGHSLGGHNGLFTAAFEPRLRVVVTSCGFTSFARYKGGNLAGWWGPRYMPRLKNLYPSPDRMPFDFSDLLAAIAPTAVFISAPLHDDNFDVVGVKETLRLASPRYRDLGAGDRLVAEHPDCGHDWPPEVRARAYRFMERWTPGRPRE